MFRLALAASLAAAACTDEVNQPAADPAAGLNEAVFRCNVEPILARQCSYNGCHGQAGAALRVYTPGKLRATPPATIDDAIAPLTTAEEHGNFTSAGGFAAGGVAPEDNFLARKPLPSAAGGFEHKGGAIYSGTDDPQYVAITKWLAGTGKCSP